MPLGYVSSEEEELFKQHKQATTMKTFDNLNFIDKYNTVASNTLYFEIACESKIFLKTKKNAKKFKES